MRRRRAGPQHPAVRGRPRDRRRGRAPARRRGGRGPRRPQHGLPVAQGHPPRRRRRPAGAHRPGRPDRRGRGRGRRGRPGDGQDAQGRRRRAPDLPRRPAAPRATAAPPRSPCTPAPPSSSTPATPTGRRSPTLKQALPDVPVLGNGDVWEAADALAMLAQTGCDGVVVGRGCLGRPWLFRDLADAFAGRPLQGPPVLGTVVEVMKEHVRLLVAHRQSERYGTRDFRKHVGWYLTGYPVGGVKRRQLSEVASIAQVDALLDELDPTTELPAEALRMPRGHTYGPKAVALPEGWLRLGARHRGARGRRRLDLRGLTPARRRHGSRAQPLLEVAGTLRSRDAAGGTTDELAATRTAATSGRSSRWPSAACSPCCCRRTPSTPGPGGRGRRCGRCSPAVLAWLALRLPPGSRLVDVPPLLFFVVAAPAELAGGRRAVGPGPADPAAGAVVRPVRHPRRAAGRRRRHRAVLPRAAPAGRAAALRRRATGGAPWLGAGRRRPLPGAAAGRRGAAGQPARAEPAGRRAGVGAARRHRARDHRHRSGRPDPLFSEGAEQMLGRSSAQMLGRPLTALHLPGELAARAALLGVADDAASWSPTSPATGSTHPRPGPTAARTGPRCRCA